MACAQLRTTGAAARLTSSASLALSTGGVSSMMSSSMRFARVRSTNVWPPVDASLSVAVSRRLPCCCCCCVLLLIPLCCGDVLTVLLHASSAFLLHAYFSAARSCTLLARPARSFVVIGRTKKKVAGLFFLFFF